MLTAKAPKPKRCKAKGCCVIFAPSRPMQRVCSLTCAAAVAREKRELEEREAARRDRVETRRLLEEMKSLPKLHEEAQREFNRYIRLRDWGLRCIDCDRPMGDTALTGGGIDAGHYRSRSTAQHLRYHEDNVHAQRKDCNRFGAGRAVEYRLGLIRRRGLAVVEALETDNRVHKWTRTEVRDIRDTYRARANALAKQLKLKAPTT